MSNISKAAVIGSGMMGAQIAAQFANIGIEVVLLDIVLENKDDRNYLSKNAIKNLKKSSAIMRNEVLYSIIPGNLEDDLDKLNSVDIVIEAVIEDIDIKKNVFESIVPYLKEDCIIATNTSGISINSISNTVPNSHVKNFLGIHFFNPPRFMHLVEVIPSKLTSKKIIEKIKLFLKNNLGKGVIISNDTPNFIANRMGIMTTLNIMREAENTKWTLKDIDMLMGKLIGRAKPGVYALGDLVGIDIIHAVANNGRSIPSEKSFFEEPLFINEMIKNKQLGRKTNAGFYKRDKTGDYQLDLRTMKYIPKSISPDIEDYVNKLSKIPFDARLNKIMESNDVISKFIWKNISDFLVFAANSVSVATSDYKDIDNAMKWGFNWEMGPFELWSLMGEHSVYKNLISNGYTLPDWISKKIESSSSFYKNEEKKNSEQILSKNRNWMLALDKEDILTFTILSQNCVINSQVSEGLRKAINTLEESEAIGLIIESDSTNFSYGADLKEIQNLIENNKFKDIEEQVAYLEETNLRLKYASKPVVTLINGKVLGGGCEIAMHSPIVIANAESYLGLVEVGVGLIPGGGGTKELAMRALKRSNLTHPEKNFKFIKEAVYTIAQGKISNNAFEAKKLGYLKETDIIMFNKSKMKNTAIDLIKIEHNKGYLPEPKQFLTIPGKTAYYQIKYEIEAMKKGDFISDYDAIISLEIAKVIAGLNKTPYQIVTDVDILNEEKQSFVELAKNKYTYERILNMLSTGKPLRN